MQATWTICGLDEGDGQPAPMGMLCPHHGLPTLSTLPRRPAPYLPALPVTAPVLSKEPFPTKGPVHLMGVGGAPVIVINHKCISIADPTAQSNANRMNEKNGVLSM